MNSSKLKNRLARSLGVDEKRIESLLEQIEKDSLFHYEFKILDQAPDFLKKEPYHSFLEGANQIMLSVCSLGPLIDRRISQLSHSDLAEAYLFDQCANLYLEHLADDFEKKLPFVCTRRFCPGYQGSSIHDNAKIFKIVRPSGIELSKDHIMAPSKSMAGILGIGIERQLECSNCIPGCTKEKKCFL